MKFLLFITLSAALILPACNTKNKKDDSTAKQTVSQVQTPAKEQQTKQPEEALQEEKPATFKEAVVKFFSPSPSASSKKAAEQQKQQARQQEDSLNKVEAAPVKDTAVASIKKEQKTDVEQAANQATPEQKTEEPKFPELDANDDAKAIIMKTDDGRLTSPFYLAEQASPEKVKNLIKPVWFGETLKYNVGWSFIVAGVAELRTTRVIDNNGTLAYELRADANSHSIIDSIFKVRDINISWLDITRPRSLGYWQSVREGKYARDEWAIFDYTTNTYNNHRQDRDGNIKTQQVAFVGNNILDMLSSLYYVRMQGLPDKGEIYFDIINRKQQYPLKVTVLGKKRVKVKAGEFDTIIVEPQFSGEGIFTSKGKSLKVWLTDDERKLPVKMAVDVFIGSVTAELTEYSIEDQQNAQAETK